MRKKIFGISLLLFLVLSIFFVFHFSGQTDREYVRVEILNATSTAGLGEKFAEILKSKNCDVICIARVKCDSFPRTSVVERMRKNKANARIVSNIIRCHNTFIEIDSTMNVDATVIIGEDFEKYIK